MRTSYAIGILTVALLGLTNTALAGSHLWRVNEVFSNADGTIQFIELKECCGASNENGISTHPVESLATGAVFDFPANLVGDTANKYLLLATNGFTALAGAPTPDYIIPDNFVSTTLTETIRYVPYDATMAIPAGMLPTDGVTSVHDVISGSPAFTMGANSPTNFAGATGTIDAGGNNPTPEVEFMVATSSVDEFAPSHNVMVRLTGTGGATTEAISVTIDETASGTATPGADYAAIGSVTLLFAAGSADGAAIPLTISLSDDLDLEGPETIELSITATAGASSGVGTNALHTVTLIDDEIAPPGTQFQRGDVNQDGNFDIADPVRLLAALFSGQPVTCDLATDVNDDEAVNIADAIAALGNLFSGAPAPAAPFGACGIDPTPGSVTCTSHAQCP